MSECGWVGGDRAAQFNAATRVDQALLRRHLANLAVGRVGVERRCHECEGKCLYVCVCVAAMVIQSW